MAVGFLNFDTKHAVAESTKLKATIAGHVYNVKAAANIDNGCIIGLGNYTSPEYYAEGAASSTFAAKIIDTVGSDKFRVQVTACSAGDLFVLTPPLIYEDYTTRMQHESNFYNEKDSIMRCYELYVGDVFTVSKEAFTGTPEKGKTLSVVSKKLKVATA